MSGKDDTGDLGGRIEDLAVGGEERCKSAHESGGCVNSVDHVAGGGGGGGGCDGRHCCFLLHPPQVREMWWIRRAVVANGRIAQWKWAD
jgi:hypothetical protein